MPRLAKQLEDEIRRIVREEIYAVIRERNLEAFKREYEGNWDFNEVRFLREARLQHPEFVETHESSFWTSESFANEIEPWDYNFWFDRGSWGHRCYPSGRTVELRIDRDECPACGVDRPATASERKHTQPVGTILDRGEDEHGFWWTVKLDDDYWLHECVTFGRRQIIIFGDYCRSCGVERSQARTSTDD